MPALTLLEGVPYYVTVVATNRAGPRLSANASSAELAIDTSPPVPAAVYNTCGFFVWRGRGVRVGGGGGDYQNVVGWLFAWVAEGRERREASI